MKQEMSDFEFLRIVGLLESTGLCPFSYSGRGMFGKLCLAVTPDDGRDEFTIGMDVAVEAHALGMDDSWIEPLRRPHRDSMGRGVVLYFPNIPWKELA